MDITSSLAEFAKYKEIFSILENLAYKDISINSMSIRPLGLHFMNYGPEWMVGKHVHSFFEAHYITEGIANTFINGIEFNIEPGCFYVMPPGTFHSHKQPNSSYHIGFAVRWEFENKGHTSENEFNRDVKELTEVFQNITPSPLKDDGTILKAMIDILETAKKGSRVLEQQIAFFRLIIQLANSYSFQESKPSLAVNRNFIDSNIVNTAVRFIEENYSQTINVNDVANSVHLSYSHLSRIFKAYLGISVNQYINKIRIKRSQYLLKCTNRDIDSITCDVGFQSSVYFCSIFKKEIGISPGQYRKKNARLIE